MSYVVLKPHYQPEEIYATEAEAEAVAVEWLKQYPTQDVYVAQLTKRFTASVNIASGDLPAPAAPAA